MKTKLLLTLALLLSFATQAQTTAIPDSAFEQRLIDLGYYNVIDGQVLTANINTVTALNINDIAITDLTGIEDFNALENLFARNTNITNLDLSSNANLEFLSINSTSNSYQTIDVSNTNVSSMVLATPNLASLNISNVITLSSFDLNSFTNLSTFIASGALNLSNLVIQITSLSIFKVDGTALETINLSTNPNLTEVNFSNNSNLNTLNLKNGNNTSLTQFSSISTPNLACIQVDDVAYSNTNWTNIDMNNLFSTNCSGITSIPDANFEQHLISIGADDVIDGQVITSDINSITALYISHNDLISDLTGIEDFTALEELRLINSGGFSTIDLSNNTNLIEVYLYNCSSLTTLNLGLNDIILGINDTLTTLDVRNTNLSSLNLNGFNILSSLDISNNDNLTMLDVRYCYNLNTLDIVNIPLTTLEMALNDFSSLTIDSTSLSTIDLTSTMNSNGTCNILDNPNLQSIDVNDSFDTLNINNNSMLGGVYTSSSNIDVLVINNNSMLSSVDTSNSNIAGLYLPDNPNLYDLNLNNNLQFLDITNTGITSLNLNNLNQLFYLNVNPNSSITDITLTGNQDIQYLDIRNTPNLNYINISYNQNFSGLVAYNNPALTYVNLSGNNYLNTPDISTWVNLSELNISGTNVSSLDVSLNPNLTALDLSSTNITTVDVTSNPNLLSLDLSSTNITTVDVTSNPNLLSLDLSNTNITTVDVTSNPNLSSLDVSNTNLSALDVSSNSNLSALDVKSNTSITELNMQNGNNSTMTSGNFDSLYTPNLSCIQVDDVAYANATWTNVDPANTFSLDCSATLSVNENELDVDFSIYPNPVSDVLNVSTSSVINSLKLYDLKGKFLIASKNSSIDTSFLSSGIYILKIETEKGIENRKIIKK